MKKNMTLALRKSHPWLRTYQPDGDGGAGAGAGAGGGAGGAAAGAAGAGGAGSAAGAGAGGSNGTGGTGDEEDKPKFTQRQYNLLLAEERRKHEDTTKKRITDLEEMLKKEKGMSTSSREQLEKQLEDSRNSLLTKEEQTKKELEKRDKKLKETTESLSSERDTWRGQYASEVTRNQIAKAAQVHDAVSIEQMEEFLMPKTVLVEIPNDDDKAPKRYGPRVNYRTKNEKSEEITLVLTIDEAVKRMKDEPERFGNLFKSGLSGGLGGGGSSGGGGGASGKPPTDPAAFRIWRKQRLGRK